MPLVRFEVRNELSLGQGELYREANREEDPKAVLDAVAVSAFLGILRQLGDLAEFAAEVFHGLQDQVMSTASRSHKLMVRVQNIEAALPPLEKVVLSQTSHIHFAYTAGSEWHPCIQNEQNHFIYNDLPRFIMDSYEECRDPPRLHLLDKFDTGGPGSCLKRYSDPTFFRRVSSNATEPVAEKIPKDKRARKKKKQRSSQRNRDLAHHASMSSHSSSMQFTTTVNGRTSPSHTASTNDMTKYDAGDPSNSFDSGTESGYIECVFHLNSSVQAEEDEPKEFSSSFMQHNDVACSVFPAGQPNIAGNNFHHSSSPEQVAAPSSCVTWDEKAEVVEARGQHCDEDEVSEVLAAESDLGTQDGLTANLKILNHPNIVLDDANTPKSSSIRSQLDEVESEADDFMDALNTIESESENDMYCQTKHEVEQFSSNVINEVEETIHKVTAHISNHRPSEYESPTSSASPNENIPCESPNSVSSKSFAHVQEYGISGKFSTLDSSPGIELSTSADAIDNSKVESVSNPSSSVSATSILNVQEPLSNKAISSSNKSRESQAEFSSIHSTTLWTNGVLLGLEPSKPPDFAVSNAMSLDYLTRSEGEAGLPPNHTSMSSNDGESGRSIKDAGSMKKVPSSKGSTSWQKDQGTKVEKPYDFHHGNKYSHGYEDGLDITSSVTPGNELQHDSDSKSTPVESSQENDENLSQRLGFGHRLLVDGFTRKMPVVHDGEHEPARLPRTGAFERQCFTRKMPVVHDGEHEPARLPRTGAFERQCWQNEVTHPATPEKAYNEQLGSKYSIDLLVSSPPLEHMKISFHPIDGFEDSKLKLKFPDGSHCDESIRDMFPSFQLIPETAIPLLNMGSESDDDTFCRSSPCMSDAFLSYHSESDSEQWESDESPESKDHELYETLHRISLGESFSCSPQPGESGNNGICIDRGLQSTYTENFADPSLSSSSLDLPCFDAMNPVVNGKTKDDLDERNQLELKYLNDSSPLPPPLPPVQWRVSKPHADLTEGKQHPLSEAHEHVFDIKPLESIVPQQSKPDPAVEQKMKEETIAFEPKSKQQDQQKLNWQKEANQSANGKDIDEKEDFLHQIRTRSFILRRTAAAKPTFASGPASDKVSAILEKANAIRQAVASDDGEDDTWSDS